MNLKKVHYDNFTAENIFDIIIKFPHNQKKDFFLSTNINRKTT